MQLAAWLKRHETRPSVTQGAMAEELLDVPVTSTRAAEAEAYEVNVLGFLRIFLRAIPWRKIPTVLMLGIGCC